MRQISTEKAPAAIGPYSQAVEHNGFIFVSGQLPIDPATGAFPEGGVEAQTRQSLTNLKVILEQAGSDLGKVLKTTVFLADMNDFGAMNGIYSEFFKAPYPARCAFAVKTLPKEHSLRSSASPRRSSLTLACVAKCLGCGIHLPAPETSSFLYFGCGTESSAPEAN